MDTSLRHDKALYPKGATYKVGMIVEMYVERTVRAINEEQAGELAINRQQVKNKTINRIGYNVGDIEIVNVEENK